MVLVLLLLMVLLMVLLMAEISAMHAIRRTSWCLAGLSAPWYTLGTRQRTEGGGGQG
jgi:hypothetical protein